MARLAPAIRLLAISALVLNGFEWTASAQDEKLAAEKLVAARFTALNDKRGNRWDFNTSGGINDGTNDCFDNGGSLRIDGIQFGANRPMMTVDGGEYVLSSRVRTLNVTRRIRLDPENGAVRYLEIFENKGTAVQNVQVTIQTDLGGQAPQVLDLKDKLYFGSPSRDDPAFFAMGSSGRPGVFFLVGDSRSKLKPAIRITDGRSFQIVYPMQIPAGGTTAIVHYLAQRMNGSTNDARELLAAYVKGGRLVDSRIPKAYETFIANFKLGGTTDETESPWLLAPLQALAENAEMARDKMDGVLIDEGSKLLGTITGSDFEIETEHGKTVIPFADVAGIEGGANVARPVRVFLRNGEILGGNVKEAKIALGTESGLKVDVDLAQIRLLTMRSTAKDAVPPAEATHLLTTQRGDCMALTASDAAALEAATPWGMARIPFSEIQMLSGVREPFPAHRLTLSDRSRLVVMLRGGETVLPSLRFGPIKIVPQSIRKLQGLNVAAAPKEGENDASDDSGPYVELVGENRMAGTIDLPALHLTAETTSTAIEPAQILKLEAETGDTSVRNIVVKLIGGQELKGRLAENVLPVRAGKRVWRVPVAHLVGFHAPEPPPGAEEKQEKSEQEKKPEPAKSAEAAVPPPRK